MFIANSLFTKELIQKNFGTDSNIEIIHPCCDIERFKPSDGGEATKYEMGLSGKKILLTVGNLVMRKGHDMIIDALPRILERRPDAFYLIVGTGKDKKYLQDKVKLRGVSEHVRFEGFVEDEKLPEYYNMCDLFLMPSRERLDENDVEGFGISCIEASACGKPVIAGMSGGMRDAVLHEKTGFLVDPTNPDEICTAVLKVLSDSSLEKKLGRAGRSFVASHFSKSELGKKMWGVINSVQKTTCRLSNIDCC